MPTPSPWLIAVMGPTASGKTDLAETIADRLDAQLINADAFQAYIGMDIGTAKPAHRDRYLLLDVKQPNENYGVGEFILAALPHLRSLFESGRSAVLVGGTGLYIRALMEEYDDLLSEPDPALREELNRRHEQEGLEVLAEELTVKDPDTAAQTDLKNPARVKRALERLRLPKSPLDVELPKFARLKVGLCPDLGPLEARIESRCRAMVHNGWDLEVERLLAAGYSESDPGFRAIGYRPLASYLQGQSELEEAITTTIVETRRYAKRQRTWLRSEPDLKQVSSIDEGLSLVKSATNI